MMHLRFDQLVMRDARRTFIRRTDRQTASDYYKIVKRRNKIIRLERVNSAGTVTDGVATYATDDYPNIEFKYSDNGTLDSAIQKGSTGEIQMMKSYSQNFGSVIMVT